MKIVKIARKHIIAAMEADGVELDFPKYTIVATYYRRWKRGGNAGVRVSWTIK